MKFDLLGFSLTKLSQYISVLSLMINGTHPDTGQSYPGITRSLFFLGHDPIGWRLQVLWIVIPTGYEQKYSAFMMKRQMEIQANHGNGRPVKTGGVKPLGMIATKGGGAKEEKPGQYPALSTSVTTLSPASTVTQEQPPGDPPTPEM